MAILALDDQIPHLAEGAWVTDSARVIGKAVLRSDNDPRTDRANRLYQQS